MQLLNCLFLIFPGTKTVTVNEGENVILPCLLPRPTNGFTWYTNAVSDSNVVATFITAMDIYAFFGHLKKRASIQEATGDLTIYSVNPESDEHVYICQGEFHQREYNVIIQHGILFAYMNPTQK